MSNVVLLIFEGQRTEPAIANSLQRFYLSNNDLVVRKAAYGFNIYKLFKMLEQDDGLSVVGVIQEQLKERKEMHSQKLTDDEQWLVDLNDQDVISDIYLLFDYDPHCRNAENEQLIKYLEIFDNSMDSGALFISYPMVESTRHIAINAGSAWLTYEIDKSSQFGKKYKALTAKVNPQLADWAKYDENTWQMIIETHLIRAQQLMVNEEQLPTRVYSQYEIFNQQLNVYVKRNNQVVVISAIPLMLHDYYGNSLLAIFQ